MSVPAVLEASGLCVARGGRGVLNDVSLNIKTGTVTAICGPNGAGKSTLLEALAGLVPLQSGAVLLGGRALAEIPALQRARQLGYLPQAAEIAWDVAVRNLVMLGRMPHRDADHRIVQDVMKALDLLPFAARPVSQLSGGERARALLARVLAGTPEWILADEPLAALDIAHQDNLVCHLRQAAKGGAGVVLVLHDLALAMNHADRIVVLDEGRIAADGPGAAALAPAIIRRVWGVECEWLGSQGRFALSTGPAR
ncbi:ABC transporter ATP-binding protein [Pseudopontixanthobacter vadosimaris]|uniref:ABC transporter ATP-binding protein n=1 Tax=Pseudopontixanthobacter vadosimaris TaxID=2726450 RepID=UPI001474471F|nr:ABC transporter ATP-binding protein [Pseudopontixanthobacter vadosimaris]